MGETGRREVWRAFWCEVGRLDNRHIRFHTAIRRHAPSVYQETTGYDPPYDSYNGPAAFGVHQCTRQLRYPGSEFGVLSSVGFACCLLVAACRLTHSSAI